jgi:lipoprotein-anchoring transpeptidase ErfK/SrfK
LRKLWIAAACLICVTAHAAALAPPDKGKGKARKHKASTHAPREAPIDANTVNDPSLTETVGPGASANAVLRAQVLLARAHFSCGEIDGHFGTNLERAITDYQAARGISQTGRADAATWKALDSDPAPALVRVQVAPEDVAGPFEQIPEDMMDKAKLPALSYSSPLEGIAEKYHSSPALLKKLNPEASFDRAGEDIVVPNVSVPAPEKAASIAVSKSRRTVSALDSSGRVIARYPATIGSEHDPLPIGKWKVLGVAKNPPFHYNPNLFWDAKEHDEKAHIAPGPNNPVGVAWIDLSKEHYGIHGTPEPSQIGKTQSHGCIRLTNWDVTELAAVVGPGTPAILEE